jgi:uncharacterized RDD family membrane protein YckC
MYCTRCGTQLPESAAYCHVCGQAVSPEPAAVGMQTVFLTAASLPPADAVETAPPVVSHAYAGFWLRLGAWIIDKIVLTLAFAAIAAVVVAALIVDLAHYRPPAVYPHGTNVFASYPMIFRLWDFERQTRVFPQAAFVATVAGLSAFFLAAWLYYAWMESSASQGTLGKMLLGLAVTDMNGEAITFGRASGRFFARFITNLVPFVAGYLMAGLTRKKQALHDVLASCLVLRKQ